MTVKYERSVLLIEDSPEDAEAITRALKAAGLDIPVIHLSDGDAALDHFSAVRGGTERRPALVILDLNLPGTDGRDILKLVKMDPDTTDIPVLVFTSSKRERDVSDCYHVGANYLAKPVDYKSMLKMAETVLDYWFRTVLIPPPKGVGC